MKDHCPENGSGSGVGVGVGDGVGDGVGEGVGDGVGDGVGVGVAIMVSAGTRLDLGSAFTEGGSFTQQPQIKAIAQNARNTDDI